MLCDSKTGNIGWNQTSESNKDKTESALHERDKDTYKDPKARDKAAHPWQYSGVCYADHLND
ncbi:MAG: hypothetical protein HY855_06365 [Burkholderiales bacterium]|nr:hypothetical protein [Burkholderiales bacterium]